MAWYVVRDTGKGMRRNAGLVAATTIVVSLAVMLAGAGVLTRTAVDATAQRFTDGVEFVVYLQPGATSTDTARVRSALEEASGVDRIEHISQERAFDEFSEMYAEETAMVEAVTPDLLPSSFRVAPKVADPAVINRAVQPLQQDPAVYEIVTADDAVRDVRDLSATAATAATVLTAALSVVALVLCAAMIRTSIAARRKEISVQRLVGASRTYIAAPLVLEGVFCAAAAAVVAATSLWVLSQVAASSSSRVLTALIPPATAATSVAVAAVAAAALFAVGLISAVSAALALRGVR